MSLFASFPTRNIADVEVGAIGYGLMNLTWKPSQTPDAQAFEAMKLAIDSGATMFNSGSFYGQPEPTLGIQLLGRFFEAYPDYASKVFLSVKGGVRMDKGIDNSLEGTRRECELINKTLKVRKMDLYEPARIDPKFTIEETMETLKTMVSEGHMKYIGLSEISAKTLRAAVQVHPVAAVEAEYSPWALDIEKNGLLAACRELRVPIVAYSPLGRGFLTGSLKSRADLPDGDHRLTFDRFSEENFPKNLELVEKLKTIADKKGITPAQLALAWIAAQWEGIISIPGSTRPAGVKESLEAAHIRLTSEELKNIRDVVDSAEIIGGRYNKHSESMLAV